MIAPWPFLWTVHFNSQASHNDVSVFRYSTVCSCQGFETWVFSTDFRQILSSEISWKYPSNGCRVVHVDRQTDGRADGRTHRRDEANRNLNIKTHYLGATWSVTSREGHVPRMCWEQNRRTGLWGEWQSDRMANVVCSYGMSGTCSTHGRQ